MTDNKLEDGDLIPRPEVKEFKPTMATPLPSFRCTKIKSDGERCKNFGITGMLPENAKCVFHGGRLPSVQEKAAARVEAARMKLLDNAGLAADTLVALTVVGTADGVRLKAATEILDRTGIRGGVEIDVTGDIEVNTADDVRKRLAKLALGEAVLDVEVVEPEPEDTEE